MGSNCLGSGLAFCLKGKKQDLTPIQQLFRELLAADSGELLTA